MATFLKLLLLSLQKPQKYGTHITEKLIRSCFGNVNYYYCTTFSLEAKLKNVMNTRKL